MELPETFTRQLGPLPTWAWMGLGLGAALGVASWRRNKAQGQGQEDGELSSDSSPYVLPGNLAPTYAFVDADSTTITWPDHPPGGGRPPVPPVADPAGTPRIKTGPAVTTATPAQIAALKAAGVKASAPTPAAPKPAVPRAPGTINAIRTPAAKPKTAPKAPSGQYVTVARWTPKNTAWNATIQGIARKMYGKAERWTGIWNAPQNASLKKKRGSVDNLQPGDKIWVPK